MPYMIGLTGSIGTGKSTVSAYFEQQGATVIDADVIAHALTAPHSQAERAIIEHFGPMVSKPDGRLNRAALRAHIFQDAEAKHWLESYLHPPITQHIQALQQKVQTAYALIVLPIIRADSKKRFQLDTLYAVQCPLATQLHRVQMRDQITRDAAHAIITQQKQDPAWIDHVIDNSGSKAALEETLHTLHMQFLQARNA
jgi:dephospho-CoA kinase